MKLIPVIAGLVMASAAHAQPLVPATDKASADIFLSGALTSAANAETVYTWDVKLTYPRVETRLGRSSNWLLASPVFEFAANKGTNANPDRIAAGGAAAIDFFTGSITRRLVPDVLWLHTVTGEFDRDRTTRGLMYQMAGRLAFRTFFTGARAPLAFVPRVEGGFELGENYVNRLEPGDWGRSNASTAAPPRFRSWGSRG